MGSESMPTQEQTYVKLHAPEHTQKQSESRRLLAFGLLLCFFMMTLINSISVLAAEEPENLHALSAVLMDADSGRVLFEKEGETPRPMASTTKVMTCILALEKGSGDDYVQISSNAAIQPEVKLGLQVGEQYYLEDLLYSLMLKSHNDTAVAIAEHIGGSVEGFARMMNAKAKEIGCTDTYFITPNGLDAEDATAEHHTTARDLCLIMRYAIKSATYVKITSTRSHSFHDISGRRSFTVENANTLLDMNDAVLTGKTGYTSNAGYCYVCACRSLDRTFIIALLGCGWPANRTWKWTDTQNLLKYAEDHYFYRSYPEELPVLPDLIVEQGADAEGGLWSVPKLQLQYGFPKDFSERTILLKTTDTLSWRQKIPETVRAPVEEKKRLGTLTLYLDSQPLETYPILAAASVPKKNFSWVLSELSELYFH